MKAEYELTRAMRDLAYASRRDDRCFKVVFLVTLGAIVYNTFMKSGEKERGR